MRHGYVSSYGRGLYNAAGYYSGSIEVSRASVLGFKCPVCPALPGKECRARVANGHTRSISSIHPERVKEALDYRVNEYLGEEDYLVRIAIAKALGKFLPDAVDRSDFLDIVQAISDAINNKPRNRFFREEADGSEVEGED